MRTLVVDDSKAIRMILTRMLKGFGMEVGQAANGQEALDWISANGTPELALVDWNMPVMDGLTFVETVRANPANSSMRIAMVTTETEMSQVERALNAGADEYVMKPFTPDVVTEKIRSMGLTLG